MVNELIGLAVNERIDGFIFEDFVLSPFGSGHGKRNGLSPERVTAAMLMGLWHAGWYPEEGVNVWFQMAALAQDTFTDERLERLGLWCPGFKDGREAVRHALTWIRRWKQGNVKILGNGDE